MGGRLYKRCAGGVSAAFSTALGVGISGFKSGLVFLRPSLFWSGMSLLLGWACEGRGACCSRFFHSTALDNGRGRAPSRSQSARAFLEQPLEC